MKILFAMLTLLVGSSAWADPEDEGALEFEERPALGMMDEPEMGVHGPPGGGRDLTQPLEGRGVLTLEPDRIDLSVTRGEVYVKDFIIAQQQDVEILQALAVNLVDESERDFPSDHIRVLAVGPPQDPKQKSPIGAFRLSFDLTKVPAGLYRGDLLLVHRDGTYRMPVRLEVADPPYLPFFVMLLGVAGGLTMTRYQTGGKERDEMLVRWNQLPRLQDEAGMPAEWAQTLRAHQLDFENALRRKMWDDAQKAVDGADALWQVWRRDVDAWKAVHAFAKDLVEDADLDKGEQPFRRGAHDAIRKALAEGPVHRNATTVRDAVEAVRELVRRFVRVEERVETALSALDPADEDLARQLRSLRRGLDEVAFDDEMTLDALEAESQQLAVAKSATRSLDGVASFASGGGPSGVSIPPASFGAPLPALEEAALNLKMFSWATALVTVMVLAMAGFHELYSSDPTFGANPWGDYVGLLFWGLFSESARNSAWKSIEQTAPDVTGVRPAGGA